MSNFLTVLPVDVQYEIANRIDLQTLPCFMVSCKYTSSIFTNEYYFKRVTDNVEKRLNDLIDVIKEYHISLHKNDISEKIVRRILKKIDYLFEKADYFRKLAILECIDKIKKKVVDDIGCSTNTIALVSILMNSDIPLDYEQQRVAHSLIKSLLPPSEYTVKFQYTARHYIEFTLSLEDINKPTVSFMILNMAYKENQNKTNESLVHMIPTAVIDKDGWINFDLTNNNLRYMVEYVLKVFGNDTFMFKTHIVSNIEVWDDLWFRLSFDAFSDIVDDEMSAEVYKNQIINILD
jgi:hypothetical protein